MRKLFPLIAAALLFGGCEYLETLASPETGSSSSSSSSSSNSGSYTYNYSCPGTGSKVSVPIPNRLSSTCRSAWEFYARTYGCNDADRFGEAESRKRACP